MSAASDDIPPTIDDLVAAGRYQDAAIRARATGNYLRAATIYERIWEFSAAAECARDGGDLPRALRNAIDAHDETLVAQLAQALASRGTDGQREAMTVFAARRRFGDAGRYAESLGELNHAATLYHAGHQDLDAARVLIAEGNDRQAGQLLEGVIAHALGQQEQASARLLLSEVLARRMRHHDAVRHLQEAARYPTTRAAAQRALIVQLAALGLHDAAREILIEARTTEASLPASVKAVVEQQAQPSAMPQTQTPQTQLIAGRYRVERLLGSGGAGRVYLAYDEVTDHRVAVKVFNTLQARGREAYDRFVREARIAGTLRHQNLVEVLDVSAEHGFLVMEYMVGGSLADRIVPILSERAVKRMALDVLAGLELAHMRCIVHRDVKPPNVFFDARGTAKLGDFGVAHLLDLGQTQTGGLIGTLAYMSPEQITGAPLTVSADLYSFGVTLFQSLTGRIPFIGPDFVAQHLGEPAPCPSTLRASLQTPWDGILTRLLAKSPNERYDSIRELRCDIDAIDTGNHTAPLLLHRTPQRVSPTEEPTRDTPFVKAPHPLAEPGERYKFQTVLGHTPHSQLRRALDTALNRSVMIEQFDEGAINDAIEQRLYAVARGGGPYLQRALAYDREQRITVFEAPAGSTLADAYATVPMAYRDATRMLKRLARAVAPLHAAGAAHGALDTTSIVLDNAGHPTVLTCGLGPIRSTTSAANDAATLISIIASLMRLPRADGATIIEAGTAHLSPHKQSMLTTLAQPSTGEQLYEFADALEIAILQKSSQAPLQGERI